MANSAKVLDRISSHLKKYQTILADAQAREVSESDTVLIIVDMLSDVLGYKKYSEITTEHSIRGVNLAAKVGDEVRFLIEARAIGSPLKENHVKQAVDYGAANGIEWIVLTNAVKWLVYKVHAKQAIGKSLIFEVDVLQANPKSPQLMECLGHLSREGFAQSFQQRQLMSKFSIAALLLSEPILHKVRRELQRLSPGCEIDVDQLATVIRADVLKRDVLESAQAKQAASTLKKAARSAARAKARAAAHTDPSTVAVQRPATPEAGETAA